MARSQAPKYRPLLPTTPRAGQSTPPTSSSVSDRLPKRKSTRIACKECHEKKRKCDGQKPSCSACRRHAQPCIYRSASSTISDESIRDELHALRGRFDVLESLVTELRTAPHAGALEALRKLRLSPSALPLDVETPSQQSEISSSMSMANGLNSPLSEPDRVAPAPVLDDFDLVQDPSSPGEETLSVVLGDPAQGVCCGQPRCALDLGSASPFSRGLFPVKIASDPRLKGLDISFWTTVPVTNLFATDVISSYLRSDDRTWELFDADYFLSDLVTQKPEFCSSFLVNCLLAFASQTYATDCSSATSKGIEFETAAGVLWQADATRLDSETALTGLMLLYLCFAARWELHNADGCLRLVHDMAVRMKLFGVEERIDDLDMCLLRADKRSSMVHAAWGAFNTMSIHRRRQLEDIASLPPLVSFPGMMLAMEVDGEDPPEEGSAAASTE